MLLHYFLLTFDSTYNPNNFMEWNSLEEEQKTNNKAQRYGRELKRERIEALLNT